MPRKQVIGDPQLWLDTFPEDQIPQIIQLVLNVWRTLPRIDRSELEVPLTRRFRSALIQDKNMRREVAVSIWRESVEDDVDLAEEVGRIDLRFTSAYRVREDVYFAFECKLLNVITPQGKFQSLAGPYVSKGMLRFVTGQYAATLNNGAMLGYVMDGKVAAARRAVEQAIQKQGSQLCLAPSAQLCNSALIPSGKVAETRHLLNSRNFILYHLFLAY